MVVGVAPVAAETPTLKGVSVGVMHNNDDTLRIGDAVSFIDADGQRCGGYLRRIGSNGQPHVVSAGWAGLVAVQPRDLTVER